LKITFFYEKILGENILGGKKNFYEKNQDFHGQFQRFFLCSGISQSISKIFRKRGVVREP
jgi:deoxyadenosine/deoxycytidine kinase